MNAALPQSEPTAFTPWLECAKRRFPRAKGIEGTGEFCVTCCSDGIVRLFETFAELAACLTSWPGSRRYHWEQQDLHTAPPKVQARSAPSYSRLRYNPADQEPD